MVHTLADPAHLPPLGAHHSLRRRPHVDRMFAVWALHHWHSSSRKRGHMTVAELRMDLETMPGDYEVVFPDMLPLVYLARNDASRTVTISDEDVEPEP